MSSQVPNINTLFGAAAASGAISAESLSTLQAADLGASIQGAMGISADAIEGSEVILLTVLDDDSGSIRTTAGNTKAVVDGTNMVVDAVRKSKSVGEILAHIALLNKGTHVPYTPVAAVQLMTTSHLNPNGGTPLYDRVIETLGAVLAKEQEFRKNGVPCRTVTLIVTDGNDEGSRMGAHNVLPIVRDMLQREVHIVAGMGISDGRTDFRRVFQEMGLEDQWILTPDNDPSSIRRAFQLFSRSSVAASQGAAGFSQALKKGVSG